MQIKLIFDSYFGNTERFARAMADAATGHDVQVIKAEEAKPGVEHNTDLLIVGSPTRAFHASPKTTAYLKRIPSGGLRDINVAAFDTRIAPEDVKPALLRFLVKLFGYAAAPIQKKLIKKGGRPVAQPEGFAVADTEGPPKDGELERAANWMRQLIAKTG